MDLYSLILSEHSYGFSVIFYKEKNYSFFWKCVDLLGNGRWIEEFDSHLIELQRLLDRGLIRLEFGLYGKNLAVVAYLCSAREIAGFRSGHV